MQERRNSTADALDLRLSCTNPSIWYNIKVIITWKLHCLIVWRNNDVAMTSYILGQDSFDRLVSLCHGLWRIYWSPTQYKDHLSRYWDSHYKDKKVVWPCYIYNGIFNSGKMASLYWDDPQVVPDSKNELTCDKKTVDLYIEIIFHQICDVKTVMFIKKSHMCGRWIPLFCLMNQGDANKTL